MSAGAQRDALLEHPRALVDERVDRPLDDLLVAEQLRRAMPAAVAVVDERDHVRDRASACDRRRSDTSPCPSSVRAGPSRRAGRRRAAFARAGFLELVQLLTHAPRDVEAAHVVDGEDPHRHTPVGERAIDLLGRRAFLDEELRLVHVGEHHPVADEPGPVADDDADLAEPLGQRQRAWRSPRRLSPRLGRFQPAASRSPG